MEVEACLKKKKEIYSSLLNLIEATDDFEDELSAFINILKKQHILQQKREILDMFRLISKLEDNHNRNPYLYIKLEKIFEYFFNDQEFQLTISEIFQIYKTNKRILYLLIEKKFINPEKIKSQLFLKKDYRLFLYPVLKPFLNDDTNKLIENETSQLGEEDFKTYEKKCQNGENDSYICTLIRDDSIENFISLVTRETISLTSAVKQSIFETNSFLIGKNPSLIEYATFFGSIQIFRYLVYNKVPLEKSLWLYAIHSNNPELIHLMEENHVEADEEKILIESIKCHHNDIANYFRDNFLNQGNNEDLNENGMSDTYDKYIIDSLNYFYFPNKVEHLICNSRRKNCFSISNLCFSLSTLSIPSSVKIIGNSALSDCSTLIQINIPPSVVLIGDSAFKNCSSLKQIEIPSSVKSIGRCSFYGCSSLTEMIIPSSVTEILDESFSGCSSLKRITIHSSVSSFGNHVFNGVKSLEISGDLTQIFCNMFNGCSSLNEIKIPSSVTSIGNYAFSECTMLNEIEFPSSVTKIGERSFGQCLSLKEIEIPSSIANIGKGAFYCSSSIKKVAIHSNVTSIENNTFYMCSSLEEINIPSSVTSICDGAFSMCSSLKKIKIPFSVTSIGNNAFNGCSSLEEIEIPPSVTNIGECAFGLCSSLKEVTIPSSVVSIGSNIFSLCSFLTQISIPSSINIDLLGINDDIKIIKK